MTGRLAAVILAGSMLGAGLSGCGATQVVDPVARAADITEHVPGYRMAMTITVATPQLASSTIHASGFIDQTSQRGLMTMSAALGGHSVRLAMVFSGTTFYMGMSGIPGLSSITQGKPWAKVDFGSVMNQVGLGGLPLTSNDPRRFLDFLRAAGGTATRIGSDTVRGVSTTRYHVTINLDRYAQVVAPSRRPVARRLLAVFEAALHGHTLPADVWLDASKHVREIQLNFPECVSGQHIALGMTLYFYDYGPQPTVQLPPGGQTYDLTSLFAKQASNLQPGC